MEPSRKRQKIDNHQIKIEKKKRKCRKTIRKLPKDDNNNFIPRLTKFIEEYKTIKRQVEKLEKENKSLKRKLQKYENNKMCELCKIIVMMIN